MQRKQFLVKLQDKNDGNQFIEYLEYNGLVNVHNVCFDSLRIKVLVIHDKKFFSTNVTCLAALASCGIKPIGTDEFKAKFEAELNIINSL